MKMALVGTPRRRNDRPLETWLDTLTPEARAEAEEYMRDVDGYAHEELRRVFELNGYKGSEKTIARWRKNL